MSFQIRKWLLGSKNAKSNGNNHKRLNIAKITSPPKKTAADPLKNWDIKIPTIRSKSSCFWEYYIVKYCVGCSQISLVVEESRVKLALAYDTFWSDNFKPIRVGTVLILMVDRWNLSHLALSLKQSVHRTADLISIGAFQLNHWLPSDGSHTGTPQQAGGLCDKQFHRKVWISQWSVRAQIVDHIRRPCNHLRTRRENGFRDACRVFWSSPLAIGLIVFNRKVQLNVFTVFSPVASYRTRITFILYCCQKINLNLDSTTGLVLFLFLSTHPGVPPVFHIWGRAYMNGRSL